MSEIKLSDPQNEIDYSADEFRIDPELIETIKDLLVNERLAEISSLLEDLHTADIAELISQLHAGARDNIIALIPQIKIPDLLKNLEDEILSGVLSTLGSRKSAEALAELDVDEIVSIVEYLDEALRIKILARLAPELSGKIRDSLQYPEESAGRLMDVDFIAIPEHWNIGQTIDFLRNSDNLPDEFYSIFVIDSDRRPIGSAKLSRVMRQNREVKIRDIMDPEIRTISLGTDQEEIAHLFTKYKLVAAPVVNENGIMVATISLDEIVEIVEDEAEEDLLRLTSGVGEIDIYSTVKQTAINRFPWLFINLFSALAVTRVISFFESSIEQFVTLAVLMPVVGSLAGNSGTQTMTVAVRALATRSLTSTNRFRVFFKELFAASINGLILAVITGSISYLFYRNIELSLIFGTASFLGLLVGAFAGAAIPQIFERFKIDPALASGVFLTAVTDLSGLLLFLGLSSWLLLN